MSKFAKFHLAVYTIFFAVIGGMILAQPNPPPPPAPTVHSALVKVAEAIWEVL